MTVFERPILSVILLRDSPMSLLVRIRSLSHFPSHNFQIFLRTEQLRSEYSSKSLLNEEQKYTPITSRFAHNYYCYFQ